MSISDSQTQSLMQLVESRLPLSQVMLFWEWLGNVKYVQDEHILTTERAEDIRRNVGNLIAEWRGSTAP